MRSERTGERNEERGEDTPSEVTLQSDVGRLRRVVLAHARDAFVNQRRVDEQWERLDYLGAPEYDAAVRESDAFAALLEALGVRVEWMPAADVHDGGLDAIYVRDAALVCDRGAVLARMGKPSRREEPARIGRALERLGIPTLGRIEAPGTLEGGDTTWLDTRTLAVARGPRTNAAGIEQLRALLSHVDVIDVPLPDWRAPGDVFHLMSGLSPLAPDLALVHRPLLPAAFLNELLERGFTLADVPGSELASQGPNVLAVAPRVAIALQGNPVTRQRMEAAGVEVHTYAGDHISVMGCGGPTCLTRPLERAGWS
jgi:N-dimethylarginine dimethylaminohydrolase